HAFSHQNTRDARRPDHSSGMELYELHVDQIRAGVVGQRMTIACVFPTIARYLVGSPDTARCEHDSFCSEQHEPPAFPFISEGAGPEVAIFEKADESAFHVHADALMDTVILKGADHLQARAIADVNQSWIFVSAEVSLKNLSVFSSVEDRAPCLQFADASCRLFGMQLRHAPTIDVLAAAHRIGKMDSPVISTVGCAQRGGNTAFSHHRVCFT